MLHRASFSIVNPHKETMVLRATTLSFKKKYCSSKTWSKGRALVTTTITVDNTVIKGTTITIAPESTASIQWGHKGHSVYQSCSKMAYQVEFVTSTKKQVNLSIPVSVKRMQPYRPRTN